jgi:hypothetical protein
MVLMGTRREVITEKSEYVFMYRQQHAGKNHYLLIVREDHIFRKNSDDLI